MFEAIERFENLKAVTYIRRFFNSWIFPVVTAAVILFCYYLSLDILAFWYLTISGVAILVTCRDITPFLVIILFLNLPISFKNSPSPNNPNHTDYYFRTGNVVQLFLMAALLVTSAITRLVTGIVFRRFKLTPLFIGVCALGVAFLFNGVGFKGYDALNLMYGCALAAIYVGFFVFFGGNVKMTKDNVKRLALYLIVLSGVLSIELIVKLATTKGVFYNDWINRDALFFGWATYNNMGVLLVATIPAWFYLACKCKFGYIYLFGAMINFAMAFLSMSRQAMLMSCIIFLVCAIWSIIAVQEKKNKIIFGCVFAAILVAIIVLVIYLFAGRVDFMFKGILSANDEASSGRIGAWKIGVSDFKTSPVFGVGFYGGNIGGWDYGASGLDRVPRFYHNTGVQLMASCGIVGLIAYAFHRVQTVISFFKKVNSERIFIALCMCGIMLCSLLDVHIFSPFAAMIYAMLVPCLSLGTTPQEEAEG